MILTPNEEQVNLVQDADGCVCKCSEPGLGDGEQAEESGMRCVGGDLKHNEEQEDEDVWR